MRLRYLAIHILAVVVSAGTAGAAELVVHEWGTFTSFQD